MSAKAPLGLLLLKGIVIAVALSDAFGAESPNYSRATEPAVRPAFIPLPPGAVEPSGWLRDWALAARNGITGHLDEYHTTFADAWKGVPVKAPGAAPDGTGWPLEQCSYWLDGLIRLGFVLHDNLLIQKATARLRLVVDGVNSNGTSFIYWKAEPPKGCNSWAHSQIGRALVAWYEATGDKPVIEALRTAYRNYPTPMGHLRFNDVSGLCNLDGLLETYSFTADQRLLEQARMAMNAPDVQSVISDWLQNRFTPGHAVCAYEQIRLPALAHLWMNEPKYLQASRNAFKWFESAHLLPYGVTSGEEYLSGKGAFRLTETCDVAAQIWSTVWLYRITGEATWGDSIERAFFNAGAAPIARDFQTMCYYQSPNRLQPESLPAEQPTSPGRGCLRFSPLGYSNVLCCVGAVNRIVPTYVMHMWMATYDQGLAATLYGPCTVSALVGSRMPLNLTCQTTYPFDETIKLSVGLARKASFPLYFRVPAWCRKPRISVNGALVRKLPDTNGFVRIERQWNNRDTVTLVLPMSIEVARGYEKEYPISTRSYFNFKPEVLFQKRQLPFENISYGPLLFALPIADENPNRQQPGVPWQYALDNRVEQNGRDITVVRKVMPPKWDWPLEAPIALEVSAKRFDWNPTDAQPLPDAPMEQGDPETIRLVPYGCTKFRVAMFPVTSRAWGATFEGRNTISLDGRWEIAEGTMDAVPDRFDHHIPVPGLLDQAQPAFAEVGQKSSLRQAFWYRRTFQLKGLVPAVASLKVSKAAYGTRVYLNGVLLGDHLASFTPGYFDARAALRGNGETNEIVVRVGAWRDSVPASIPSGFDFEKIRYIPGLFDSVELILSATPNLLRVQAAPDITNQSVRVQALVHNAGPKTTTSLRFKVRELRSGKLSGEASSEPCTLEHDAEQTIEARIPIRHCRLWSPEDPFLYELETTTGADTFETRFGMREFRLDHESGRAFLNGRPYFLRGSNVTLYRFFEDPNCNDFPWREDWVRDLHRAFKKMHWNALRYCIGFPPEMWYRIADEEGMLIQDEFPIWHGTKWPAELKSEELVKEYTEWIRERWNHPCVVIWDAQNESKTEETGKAIQAVRSLDLSNRPWDNGYGQPQARGDSFESHPYLFNNPKFKLSGLAAMSGVPKGNAIQNSSNNPIIINEYDWLWLNRDGSSTTLSRKVYENLLGTNATPAQRRHLCARYNAALTEFWRAHRACAGVLHFCGLTYSRTNGQTCDNFMDLEKLKFEPEFQRYMADAFSPVGLMIDEWREELPAGRNSDVPVILINDLYTDWRGKVRFRLVRTGAIVSEKIVECEVPGLGQARLSFPLAVPNQPGDYQLEAALVHRGAKPVRSLRDFKVKLQADEKAFSFSP